MPPDGDAFARVYIDTATVAHLLKLKGAHSLNFYYVVFLQALFYGFDKGMYEIVSHIAGEPTLCDQFIDYIAQ